MKFFFPAGYLLFITCLIIFIAVQRMVHREIQGFLLVVFKKPRLVIALFSLILLPGVFIHELSHYLTAIALRVPVLKFSLVPQTSKDGQLRLGFVQTRRCDPVRDSLIGIAPFVFGLIVIGLIGSARLGMESVVKALFLADAQGIVQSFLESTRRTDFWVWVYLAFSISSAMLPSGSDRQSWKLIVIGVIIVLIGLLLVGLGGWLYSEISPRLEEWVRSIAFVLVTSTIIHAIIYLPIFILRLIISRITGRQLVRA